MPIRADLRPLYGPDWQTLSNRIRFGRAKGRCERCGRPHGQYVLFLPDGRWTAPSEPWRSADGVEVGPPEVRDWHHARATRVVLTTAHIDQDPRNNDEANLAAWCQRCHLLHDAAQHRALRWLSWRARLAAGDLFLGAYNAAGYPPRAIMIALEAARRARK